MTAEEKALRLEKRSPQSCVVLLWDPDGVIRVVRRGRVSVMTMEPSDFSDRPVKAARWAVEHYRVDVVYVGVCRNDEDEVKFKRYTGKRRSAGR